MNLCILFLAWGWANIGSKNAIRFLPTKKSFPGAQNEGSPWPELLGWLGGSGAILLLSYFGAVTQAREATGFSGADFLWTMTILVTTWGAGFCSTATFQIATRKQK